MSKTPKAVLRLDEMMLATQQLSFFLDNGINIVPALLTLGLSGTQRLRRVLDQVREAVEGGHTLSQALSEQPQSFPPVYLRSVRAAEKTGKLAATLRSLSVQFGKQLASRQKLTSALTYPLCVLGAATLMIAFLLYVQVPIFLRIFQETGAPLPALTQALVWLSRPQLGLLGVVAALTGAVYIRHLHSTREGRRALQSFYYPLPVVGRILKLSDLGQLSSELATMLSNGVDLLTSLRCLAAGQSGSPYLEALPQVTERVTEGLTLSEALEAEAIYPRLMIWLLRAGEELGRPWQGLNWYGVLCQQELDDTLELSLQLIEPLIMGVLGLLVTFVAMASFLPTYQLLL